MTDSPANLLCKACGLCCSGHLFSWVRLNAPELDPVEKLGVPVIRDDPRQRGFLQPCPLWNEVCTVYTSPNYPRSCRNYKCNVFRRLMDDDLSLPNALTIIHDTLALIGEVELMLPASAGGSFRERMLDHKEKLEANPAGHSVSDFEFLRKASELLSRYESLFGVDDFIDYEV